ncbi:RTL1: Retrotransposon-like 1 [Crotalus adamanteus]|uniref:RTL1: Retrotransposon-like 1 n=1 Tax=Crotalus adamanteus TaxID=8729 RepID=A0AAW1C6J9_CROAD
MYSQGVVGRLADWYRAVVELDVGLRDHPGRREDRLRRSQDQPVGGTTQTLPGTVRSRPTFRCFRCNRPGHRAAECGIPKPTGTPTAIGTPGVTPKRPAEKSRVAYQLGQSQVQQKPDEASPILQKYEEEEPVEDPMVSEPIVPFTIPITLTSPVTGESRIVNPS